MNKNTKNYIDHEGVRYYYEHRLAKDGEICLGTLNPNEYCNGVYSYSKKDPGDGLAFVVTEQEPISESGENKKKALQKRADQIAKQKERSKQPKKTISKNPKDWSNTFLCSDGTRVTQAEIDANLRESYAYTDSFSSMTRCMGCWSSVTCHAHVIAQARLKQLGKTELIWHYKGYFRSCFKCNSAIENPKGKDWKNLKNIAQCLLFIKQHDPELYAKFELSATNQEKPTI